MERKFKMFYMVTYYIMLVDLLAADNADSVNQLGKVDLFYIYTCIYM